MKRILFIVLICVLLGCVNEPTSEPVVDIETTFEAKVSQTPKENEVHTTTNPKPTPTGEITATEGSSTKVEMRSEKTAGTAIANDTIDNDDLNLSKIYDNAEASKSINKDIYLDVQFTDEVNIYLNLNIPDGFVLKELIVDKYEGHDKIAFFAIQEGTTYTAGDDIFQMVSWGHFGPSTGNILFYSDNLESENKVPVTLSSDSYSIRFAQNNFNGAKYLLVGKLIAIP